MHWLCTTACHDDLGDSFQVARLDNTQVSDLMYTPKKGGRFPPSRGLGGGSRSGTPASGSRRPGSLLTPRLLVSKIICIRGELVTRNINYSLADKTCLDDMAAVAGVVTHQCRDLKLLKQLEAMWLR